MMDKELRAKLLIQTAKGKMVGVMLAIALEDNISLQATIAKIGLDEGVAFSYWNEMHPAAHMWAASFETGLDYDPLDPNPTMLSSEQIAILLRRSEELLDAMQAREDLRCDDPWYCSAEVREAIGLKARVH